MLQVEDLRFSYGTKPVFSGVGFRVSGGTLCGLFGPNGSGKSTLFKCCLRLLKSDGGTVRISGRDASRISVPAMARLVSYVPQDHAPPFPFLAREVVLMGRAPHFGGVFGVSAEDRRAAEAALDRLGVLSLADEVYTRLSGGQRQLVLIARAIAQDTPLVMLDEPTSALDFKNQILIWRVLRELADSGKTVFACAHDPNHVSWFCDEVVVMDKGGVARTGAPREALDQNLLRELYGGVCAVGEMAGLRMVYPAAN